MAQNLEDLIVALFDCITSTADKEARGSMGESLHILGAKQPALFLTAAHTFLVKNSKLSDQNRSFIILSINKVLEKHSILEEMDEQLCLLIINLAIQEMTMTKEGDDDGANASKDLLVTLAKNEAFVGHVMDGLLQKFPPGLTVSPHRYVILALAAVAQHNASGFVHFLNDILSRAVPLFGHIKQDPIKGAWSQALCAFCEAVIESTSSEGVITSVPEPNASSKKENGIMDYKSAKQNYGDQFEAAYDVVVTSWITAKDYKSRADAMECAGTLSLMISDEKILKDLKKLITVFMNFYRKADLEQQYALTKGIANFLDATCSNETIPIEHYLDEIFNNLFPHVCIVTEQSLSTDENAKNQPSALQIRVRNEVYRCFSMASKRFADKIVYYLLHKMQNVMESTKLGATNLLRHLLNSSGANMEDKKSLIIMGLKPMLNDETLSVRVKMSMCQLCVALADHGYIQMDSGGEHVIQFLVRNLVSAPEIVYKRASTLPVDTAALNQLHSQCAQALQTIAKTCDTAYKLLWPYLFEFICAETYTPVVGDLCKCLRILVNRQKEAGEKVDFDWDYVTNVRLAGPFQVIARLFACMNGAPLNSTLASRAREALKLLEVIAEWFQESIPPVLINQLPIVYQYLEEVSVPHSESYNQLKTPVATRSSSPKSEDYSIVELKNARNQRWQAHVLDLLNACIVVVNSGDWRQSLAAAQGKQLQLYSQNSADKAFLMRCLGSTLARITNTSFVVEHALLIFRGTNHASQVERLGCAMSIGHCAQTHTDLMLTELENVAKWEHTKKSGSGIFSFIKDAMPYSKGTDADVINLRATIILSYGYVILYCPTDVVTQRLDQTVLPFLRQYMNNFKIRDYDLKFENSSGKIAWSQGESKIALVFLVQETVVREAHLETINLIATTVNPHHLMGDYKFEARYECLSYIKDYVQAENQETLSSWIRLLASKATASLAKLEPPLSDNELWDLGNVLTQFTFPLCREKSGLKTLAYLYASPNFQPIQLPTPSAITPRDSKASILQIHRSTSLADDIRRNFSELSYKCAIDDDEASTMMDATVIQYRNAISHMVAKKPVVDTVSQLLKMFIPYYGSAADHERARAIESTVLVLQVYAENAVDYTLGRASEFQPMHSLLGRLCPRLADSLCAVRHSAIRAIWLTFRLGMLHRGHSPQDTDLIDSQLFDLNKFIEEHLGSEGKLDQFKARNATATIAKEIESRLPQSQVQLYLSVLFKMLGDRQSNVSSSAAQLLSVMVNDRGPLLHDEAEILISTMLEELPKVHSIIQTYTDLLNAFSLFAGHQQYMAVDVLLKQPLPYSISNSDAWQIMAREPSQFTTVIDYILELMGGGGGDRVLSSAMSDVGSNENLHKDKEHGNVKHYEVVDTGAGNSVKIVNGESCALTSALNELIKGDEPEEALVARVPTILAVLLQMLAAMIDTQYPFYQKDPAPNAPASNSPGSKKPKGSQIITPELRRLSATPASLVAHALISLLSRIRADPIIETMNADRAWTMLVQPQQFTSAITILCRSLAEYKPKQVGLLMRIMAPKVESTCEAQRTAAVAVLSSLVTRCPKENGEFDAELLSDTIDALGKALTDSKLIIRKLAIRGHGLIGTLNGLKFVDSKVLVEKFAKRAVDAALAGLDDSRDRNDQIAIEAVDALDRLASVADIELLEQILPTLLLKIRPCFEKESPSLRAVAFSLFAELGKRVGECASFKDSLHINIVSILLHLNDVDDLVQNKCAQALLLTTPLLNSDPADTLVQHELDDGKPPRNYINFIKDFSLILALSFPDRLNFYALNCANYFKSHTTRIRTNSAHLTGFLLAALTPQLRGTLSKELIFAGLAQLLKDPTMEVRLATARAISNLYSFA